MLLYGCDIEVLEWVSLQLFEEKNGFSKEDKAIGVVLDNKLIAGVVYNRYVPNITIEMSIASIDKRWCNRHNLRAFFNYPFIQLGLERVQTLCSATDEGVIMFNKKLGFTQEGLHRKAWPMGGDAISWGMLKPECKWINHG
jgi:RimJ/RimL family protein N-acetyltransferase